MNHAHVVWLGRQCQILLSRAASMHPQLRGLLCLTNHASQLLAMSNLQGVWCLMHANKMADNWWQPQHEKNMQQLTSSCFFSLRWIGWIVYDTVKTNHNLHSCVKVAVHEETSVKGSQVIKWTAWQRHSIQAIQGFRGDGTALDIDQYGSI